MLEISSVTARQAAAQSGKLNEGYFSPLLRSLFTVKHYTLRRQPATKWDTNRIFSVFLLKLGGGGGCQLDKRHKCHNTRSCFLSTTKVTAYQQHQQKKSNITWFFDRRTRSVKTSKKKLKKKHLHLGRYDFLLFGNTNNNGVAKYAFYAKI